MSAPEFTAPPAPAAPDGVPLSTEIPDGGDNCVEPIFRHELPPPPPAPPPPAQETGNG